MGYFSIYGHKAWEYGTIRSRTTGRFQWYQNKLKREGKGEEGIIDSALPNMLGQVSSVIIVYGGGSFIKVFLLLSFWVKKRCENFDATVHDLILI